MKKLAHDIILKPVITEESMMGTAFKKITVTAKSKTETPFNLDT